MNKSSSSTFKPIEIIKDKLYWVSDRDAPKNQLNAFFFNIDNDLVYEPFFADFGPLDLGKTYRFVTELDKLLQDPKYSKSRFYHHTSLDTAKRANAAYLMGAFQVIMLNKTAEEAWKPFMDMDTPFTDFRDASYTSCTYKCSILDCLRGLEYGIKLKWFDIKNFNLRDYEFYEKVENGDLNWIIPGKFVAFSGPSGQQRDPDGYRRFTPEDYVPIFKKLGVTLVIRLNNKQYEKERFTKNGIKHLDLYFLDGSTPSDEIIQNFLTAVENEKGAVAVHCKAGLGRTGSLIAMYAMKHYRFPAPDFIGYIRLCRPGSILGPQQQFLCDKEASSHALCESQPLYKAAYPLVQDFWERRESNLTNQMESLSLMKRNMDMSPQEKKIAKLGDFGQAERLLEAKFRGKVSSQEQEPIDVTNSNDIYSNGGRSYGQGSNYKSSNSQARQLGTPQKK